ncbi:MULTISPECIES: FadR/GntR family transcriptional regulator [Sphingomonas]|uniref:DNA-binding FadR family transcriptional regulator n=1 Tax=Sphingomonas kyeonggiensis TaxID=1268553 RepID=A0A7W7JZH0_9SPHN|nr:MULTISPECIES: FadR/GntR family transcriptional regulator [Sphingomonas]MBB4838208.1 DNA-binding FadR family transcriptional regulator [Sphingomonas kyeonggiensis]WHU01333.1 FadR/GntR family transcriptional regulator [Sphingomonas sp. NIBR02145]
MPSWQPKASIPRTEKKSRTRKPRPRSLRLHGTVARTLGIRIVSGQITPGEILEGEIAASEQFKVSRTAYREAIRILAAKGLVHSRPKIGTQVSPRREWHLLDPDVLSWIFAGEPDDSLIESLFELRRIVEPDAARLAALRRTPEQLARMQEGLAGVGRHGFDSEEGRCCDEAFHSALLEASGNDFIMSLTSGVAAAIELTTAFKQQHLPAPHDALPVHLAVLEAIEAQDADRAHDAMARLVERGFQDTMEARDPANNAVGRRRAC